MLILQQTRGKYPGNGEGGSTQRAKDLVPRFGNMAPLPWPHRRLLARKSVTQLSRKKWSLIARTYNGIPQAMWPGGKKYTIDVPVNTHRLFHRVLDILIRYGSESELQSFTGNTSAAKWAEQLASKAEKKAMLVLIKQASKFVDKQCSLKGPLSLYKFVKDHENEWLGIKPKKGK